MKLKKNLKDEEDHTTKVVGIPKSYMTQFYILNTEKVRRKLFKLGYKLPEAIEEECVPLLLVNTKTKEVIKHFYTNTFIEGIQLRKKEDFLENSE